MADPGLENNLHSQRPIPTSVLLHGSALSSFLFTTHKALVKDLLCKITSDTLVSNFFLSFPSTLSGSPPGALLSTLVSAYTHVFIAKCVSSSAEDVPRVNDQADGHLLKRTVDLVTMLSFLLKEMSWGGSPSCQEQVRKCVLHLCQQGATSLPQLQL